MPTLWMVLENILEDIELKIAVEKSIDIFF